MYYYQIGGEENIFTIRKLNEKQTKIAVDQTIRFIITFPDSPGRERSILNAIEKELKDFAVYGANYQSDALFKDILKMANVPKDEVSERAAVKEALLNAPAIFRASIDDIDTVVTAVDGSKSWPVIKIWPSRVLKGQWQKGVGHKTIATVSNTSDANIDYSTEGEEYIFFLESDKELSRLCKKEIFRQIKVVPLKSKVQILDWDTDKLY